MQINSQKITLSDEQALFQAALKAHHLAYARYSGFKVGAAVMDEKKNVHSGCNVENASYPLGQCAESLAIGAMIHAGGRRIIAALVLADSAEPVTPCGGCRQRLREFASDETIIMFANTTAVQNRTMLGTLLPLSFGPKHFFKIPND